MSDPVEGEPPQYEFVHPRGTSIFERLGALAEIVLVSGFPTQLFLLAVMTTFGMRISTADGAWSPVFIWTLSILDTLLVISLVLLFLSSRRERAREVFLGARPVVREAAIGIALLPLVFLLAVTVLAVIVSYLPWLHNVTRNPFEGLMQNRRDALVFGVVAMVAGGVREEIQRAFILHRFSRYLGGGALGVILHSTVFGLGHLDQGRDVAIAVTTLGAFWGTIYLVRGSIIAPMVSHAGFNLAQVVKYLAVRSAVGA